MAVAQGAKGIGPVTEPEQLRSAIAQGLRAVRDGEVRAVARPLHVGRNTIVVQTDLADAGGRRVAQVTQVQAVLGGGSGG